MYLDQAKERLAKAERIISGWPSWVYGAAGGGSIHVAPALSDLRAAMEAIDAAEDEELAPTPVDVDDGFAILSMPRYEALRRAEEDLQETRFEPSGTEEHDDKQATIDALTRHLCDAHEEIHRLSGAAKVRAEAAAPLEPAHPRLHDEVFLKHIQDLQGEIEGIKDRLDEGCGEFNKIKARTDQTDMVATRTYNDICDRLDAQDKAVVDELCRINDRINAVAARLNRLDAREVART